MTYKAGLKVFVISQVGDLPFFIFILGVASFFQTSEIIELVALFPLQACEYAALSYNFFLYIHVNTCLALLLTSAILLKAAQ